MKKVKTLVTTQAIAESRAKYGRQSHRMQSWDYSKPGYYFVTMVVRNRRHAFGEIRDGVMHKTPLGEFVEQSWLSTPTLRPTINLWLGDFVVMPDHFHAILFIGSNVHNEHLTYDPDKGRISLESIDDLLRQKNGLRTQSNNLASVIRGFKGAVTTEARRQGVPFEWVSRYHDSIVRSAGDLLFVRRYIRSNAENWWFKAHAMLKSAPTT
ncbi:MAG: transposase [Flavobacteriales bacterium]|jgi:putative transposase